MSIVEEARDHLIDCGADADLAEVASDEEVLAEIDRHYVGGRAQFEADAALAPDWDYAIAVETGGDYAGLYGAKFWRRGERESTTFVLGRNAGIFAGYDQAVAWVEGKTGEGAGAVKAAVVADIAAEAGK